jgi:WD40 repeat protein
LQRAIVIDPAGASRDAPKASPYLRQTQHSSQRALKTSKELKKIKAHDGQANTVAFHPSGRLALSGGDGAQLSLWDLDQGKEVVTLSGHTVS